MAIELDKEEALSLTAASRVVPPVDGRHVSTCSVWRWCTKGLAGVRLESIWIGKRLCTTREALGRFFNAVSEAKRNAAVPPAVMPPVPPTRSEAARRHAIERARAQLARDGICS